MKRYLVILLALLSIPFAHGWDGDGHAVTFPPGVVGTRCANLHHWDARDDVLYFSQTWDMDDLGNRVDEAMFGVAGGTIVLSCPKFPSVEGTYELPTDYVSVSTLSDSGGAGWRVEVDKDITKEWDYDYQPTGGVACATRHVGGAHSGGDTQSEANSNMDSHAIYYARDRNRDGKINSKDEPSGETQLTAAIGSTDTTLPVGSTAGFETGINVYLEIDNEIIEATISSGSEFSVVTRGWGTTSAASHDDGSAVAARNVWHLHQRYVLDGDPYNAIGWDGETGDIFHGEGGISLAPGQSIVFFNRAIDASGNTNMENDSGVDTFFRHGHDSYITQYGTPADADGNAAMADVLRVGAVYQDDEPAPPHRRFW